MATVERNSRIHRARHAGANDAYPQGSSPLHRIAAVREQQGVSLRTVSRQLGIEMRRLKSQESETADLRLSDLYAWQSVLDVPVADLLVEPGPPLSRPVLERARLVRLMKTVMAIREQSTSVSIQRLAQTMIDQLTEIMPELKDVGPWHSVGQRRSLEEYGRAAERCLSEDLFFRSWTD